MARQPKVIVQTGSRIGRKIFEGNDADCRQYVENNFPRFHVDENTINPDQPVHDVKLVNPDGSEEVFHTHTGWIPKPVYTDDDEDSPGEDE